MKIKFKKTIAMALIISISIGVLPLVYATGVNLNILPDINMDEIVDKFGIGNNTVKPQVSVENLGDSITDPMPRSLRLNMNNDSTMIVQEEFSLPEVKMNLSDIPMDEPIIVENTEQTLNVDMDEAAFLERQSARKELLKSAYPMEYEAIRENIEDEIYHIAILEFIDYYEANDINVVIAKFNQEGYSALDSLGLSVRFYEERIIK